MTLLLGIAILMLIAVLGAVLVWFLETERNWKRARKEMETQHKKGNT